MLHRYLFKIRNNCCGVAMLVLFIISGAAYGGGVILLDDDAAPGGNGASWNTAYRFLQDALADAAGGGVDEIRAAQGTYKPDQSEANPGGTGNRQTKFQMLHGLALVGGYAGIGAKDPNARDFELYQTILSGDIGVIDSIVDNSYHVISASGANQTIILDGLIVTKGYASGASPNNRGGGLIIDNGIASVVNCTFLRNSSQQVVPAGVAAGGAISSSASNLSLINCTFRSNGATGSDSQGVIGGGAISASNSTITGSGCRFISNFAVVGNNTAPTQGGAMRMSSSTVLTLTDCFFINNVAVSSFQPHESGTGGGLYILASAASLTNCVFVGNETPAFIGGSSGAGIFVIEADVELVNCLLDGNDMGHADAGLGAGIYATSSNISATNCTIAENQIGAFLDNSHRGAGIFLDNGSVLSATNTILWGNTGGAGTPEEDQIELDNGSSATFDYCDVEGWTGQFGGTGNIGDNPLFVGGPSGTWTENFIWNEEAGQSVLIDSNASFTPGEFIGNFIDADTSQGGRHKFIIANTATTITVWGFAWPAGGAGETYDLYDFRLQSGSPSIDAADNTALPGNIGTDLDGNPRYFDDPNTKDSGIGDPPIVDMGAYEFQGLECPWDLDNSESVGTSDLLALFAQWGTAGPADFNGDGIVNTSDLIILFANWGPCP